MESSHRGASKSGWTKVGKNRGPSLTRHVILFAFLLVLSGCESASIPPTVRNALPLPCEIFAPSLWHEFRFGADSPADVAAIAVSLWGIEQDELRFSTNLRSDLVLEWSSRMEERNVSYMAWFGEERRLQGIEVSWRRPFATLAQVIDCLGPPDLYSGRYETDHEPQLDLHLWYVERGFSFNHYSYPRRRTRPPISPAQRIDGFTVVEPQSSKQAFPDIFEAGSDPVLSAIALCLIKPWPGSIEAIEVTWHDNDSRCQVLSNTFW